MLLNRTRAFEFMRRAGLDAVVATSPVNITYFTDYYSWVDPLFKEYMFSPGGSSSLSQAYAVLPLEGEPALVVNPLMAVNAEEVWVRDLHFFGDPGFDRSLEPAAVPEGARRLFEQHRKLPDAATPTQALLGILQARGLTGARIGLEMEGLTPKAASELAGKLPQAEIRDCTNLIRLVRAVKSEEELRRMARSAEINEEVAMECLAMAGPGVRASALAQHYRERSAALGADFDHFAHGPWGMGISLEADYVLNDGDVMYADFGCIFRRYFSDSGTTLAVGGLAPELSERHAALRACMAAAVAAGQPGTPVSQVRGAMAQALAERGDPISFPHGHGLGLEIRDYPILVADNGLRIRDDCVDVPSDLPLEPDMVFNLEAAIFMPGVASLHIEQTFRVTPEGCRPLVAQDRSAPIQAGAAVPTAA
jgi:Xaa-Pro aminopeptidase